MNLYQLTTQQLELKQKLMAMDLDETTIADTLEGNAGEIEEKIQSYGFVIRDRASFADAMAAEILRMTDRYTAEVTRIEKIKERLLAGMVACEIKSVECPFFTISVQNNPQSVEIFNDKLIPEEYMQTPAPKPPVAAPNKRLILEKLKAGVEVDGCKMVQKVRLVIK